MLVAVTGGTGYLGACAVAELVRRGHRVRLLARRPEQVPASAAPWKVPAEALADVVPGDVTDPATVARLLDGCDAVLHAAAIYSVDARRAKEVLATNQVAAELVLGTACDRGLDPVVHVSTTAVLARQGASGPDLPLGDLDLPYTRSKIAGELVARRLQDRGLPVVCVYPGAVLGPHDPYRGDQSERLRWQARGLLPLYPTGGTLVVDVRTVAEVVAAVMEPGRGPRRYVVPGTHVDGATLYAVLRRLTGRRLPLVVMPAPLTRVLTTSTGAVQRFLPLRLHVPADREGAEMVLRDTRMFDTPARVELGVRPRPFEETVRDTLAWMVEAGRLPRRTLRDGPV